MTVQKGEELEVMDQLSELRKGHFVKWNKDGAPHPLSFTMQVEHEDLERRLDLIQKNCKKYNIRVTPPRDMEGLLNQLQKTKDGKKKAIHLLFDEIQKEISQLEKFVKEDKHQLRKTCPNKIPVYKKFLTKHKDYVLSLD